MPLSTPVSSLIESLGACSAGCPDPWLQHPRCVIIHQRQPLSPHGVIISQRSATCHQSAPAFAAVVENLSCSAVSAVATLIGNVSPWFLNRQTRHCTPGFHTTHREKQHVDQNRCCPQKLLNEIRFLHEETVLSYVSKQSGEVCFMNASRAKKNWNTERTKKIK